MDYANLYEYENYERLSYATMACQNDTECMGVFEEACDQDGPFSLVKKVHSLCKIGYFSSICWEAYYKTLILGIKFRFKFVV